MAKYILMIGDSIKASAQDKAELMTKYNTQLKEYEQSGGRPSKEPTIWKLDVSPKK